MKISTHISSLVFLITFLLSLPVAEARQWKPTPTKAAQDYLNVNHEMENGHQVFLIWFAPQYIEPSPGIEPVVKLLEKFTLIGIVRYSVDETGRFNFHKIEEISIETSEAKVLQPLDKNTLPPLLPTFTTFLSKSLASGMGKVGQSIEYFTFDAGGIDGCGDKTFFVRYLKERYEFKGPIPGC